VDVKIDAKNYSEYAYAYFKCVYVCAGACVRFE